MFHTVVQLHCVSKNIPDVFSYNSRKHCQIFAIIGRNITKKPSNQKKLYFFHITWLMLLLYLVKLKTRKLYLFP